MRVSKNIKNINFKKLQFKSCFAILFASFFFSFLILSNSANAQVIIPGLTPAPNWSISFSFDNVQIIEGSQNNIPLNILKSAYFTYPQNIQGEVYAEIYKGELNNSQLVLSVKTDNSGTASALSSFPQNGKYFVVVYEISADCGFLGDFCLFPTQQNIQDWFLNGGTLNSFIQPPTNWGMISFEVLTNQTLPTFAYSQEQGYQNDQTSQGIEPNKGTASSTIFTFKAVYESQNNTAPQSINVIIGDGTSTSTYPMIKDLNATTTPRLYDNNYTNKEQYIYQSTKQKGKYQYHFEASDGITTIRLPETGELGFEAGYSNVMFLPGVAGSRLYEVSTKGCVYDFGNSYFKRWLPFTDCDNERLYLDPNGKSINNIVTKDVLDKAFGVSYIYNSFLNNLNLWKNTENIINDYSVIAYDWRLSVNDILTKGKKNIDGYISYLNNLSAGETPYIISELMRMASSSANGKVIIVGHSNGGLIAKELTRRLELKGKGNLIDKLILVASPQVGTPEAVATLLHGTNIGFTGFISDEKQTRYLSQNMPTAYNLLPSSEYFTTNISQNIPIAWFDNSGLYSNEVSNYGNYVNDNSKLTGYLLGVEGRTKPSYSDLNSPEKANDTLLSSADLFHDKLDLWIPNKKTKVIEIAGWGEYTTAGLKYESEIYCKSYHIEVRFFKEIYVCDEYGQKKKLKDVQTINGDGTVVSDSAHYLSNKNIAGVERWWVDLDKFNPPKGVHFPRNHRDILEINPLRQLIKNKIINISSVLDYISIIKPSNSKSVIKYELHSPLTLNLYDNQGNRTGISKTTGKVEENIPGTRYREIGDTKYIIADANIAQYLKLEGYSQGSFSLDIERLEGDTITASTTFSAIPTSSSTIATLNITPNLNLKDSKLKIDFNNDGVIDKSIPASPSGETTYDTTPPEISISFDKILKYTKSQDGEKNRNTIYKIQKTKTKLKLL